MKKLLCLSAFLMIFACSAFGDIRLPDTPTPKPTPTPKNVSIDTYMSVQLDKDAKNATLVIPRNQLSRLRAQLDELDNGADSNAANAGGIFTRTQTIASGMFLSLAMIFGGVWMARGRRKDGKINKTIAAAAILFCVGSAATIAFANVGPPPVMRSITGNLFNKDAFRSWNTARGAIKLKTSSDEGSTILLIVPDKSDNDKFQDEE